MLSKERAAIIINKLGTIYIIKGIIIPITLPDITDRAIQTGRTVIEIKKQSPKECRKIWYADLFEIRLGIKKEKDIIIELIQNNK